VLLQTIDGADADAGQHLQNAMAAQGLFGEPRLVLVNNAVLVPDIEACLSDDSSEISIYITQDARDLNADGKRRLGALVKHVSNAQRFDALEGRERIAWVTAFCRERERAITSSAAAEVIRRTGEDTWALTSELEKLCAYTEDAIDDAAVCALVAPPSVYDEWELSNALATRDKRAALAALWRRLRAGVPEQLIIGLMASATRTLVLVKEGVDRHMPAAAIAKAAGLHPFVVSKNLRSVQSVDAAAIRAAHLRIARLDRDGKRGRADIVDGLFGIIVGMA
jgi:DNA polymerase-3 subunit delta